MGEIGILDAGAQYGKVIDRRVRGEGVNSDVLPIETSLNKLRGYRGLILSGGGDSVNTPRSPRCDPEIFCSGIPVLGICYGMQIMANALGGQVQSGMVREDNEDIIRLERSPLFSGLGELETVLLTHGDSVSRVPDGFRVTAKSREGLIAAMEHTDRNLYGVQFHPEVDRTPNGNKILRNFLYDIAKCEGGYTVENRKDKAIKYIRDKVSDKKVMLLLSGGVDSAVLYALLRESIGVDHVFAYHIDNGFMRKGESTQILERFQQLGLPVTVLNKAEIFSNARITLNGELSDELCNVLSPEIKRKIIGDTFMQVVEEEMQQRGFQWESMYLAQGTLRPDLIESASRLASSHAQMIKTHHNDSPLARKFREMGKLLEPLTELHKDEVRQLGIELGLPEDIVYRQPFPGPGLAVRILCAEQPCFGEDFDSVKTTLSRFSTPEISATVLPMRTVGVQGDGRSYNYLAALSGAQDWDKLFALAQNIPKRAHAVNRVVYIFGEKLHPMTHITPTHLRSEEIRQLQEADFAVNDVLHTHGLDRTLSQVPVILFPIGFGQEGGRSIAIRTFLTNDFMTGVPAMPGREMPLDALEEVVATVLRVPGISRVAYDLTAKPPGTTEWE